jgi:TPR repeat protein
MKLIKCFKIHQIIFLLFIAYFGLPHSVFSADYNLFADYVDKLQSRADAGDSESQFMLGKFYYYGFCVERNYREAIQWFRAAAIQGHASAQFLLGEAYEKGKGLERDYTQAAKWYKRAAFQGHYLAIHSLSYLYAHGRGVRKDLINAYAWNILITAQGWDMAKSFKMELEKIMNQEQLNRAQILSIELKKKIRAPLP